MKKGMKKCADGGQPGPRVQSEYEAKRGVKRAPGGGGGPKGTGSGKPMRKSVGMVNTNMSGYRNGGRVKK